MCIRDRVSTQSTGDNTETMGLKPEVQEAFDFFDKDATGKLDKATFTKMVQSLGQTPTKADIDEIWKKCPEDVATVAEVEAMWPDIESKKKTVDQVETAFKVFDNRGHGWITEDQFKTMMASVGEGLSPQEYNIALEQARKCSEGIDTDGRDAMTDVDGKKAIYYRAFLKWMMPEYNWDGK
eukprot:TRINITY_DN577_c0_g1_i1.p1 TRINITY_DN577_c0_g1~~TRINITY_DN577_c0_g1_i1.p1  ORF type:complete len:181 (+),score=70.46 TRINITY_DN577_c0_g1_i1:182-724(+)